MPVRIGSPQGVGGLMDQLGNPAFATPIGLLLWGARHLGGDTIGPPVRQPVGAGVGRFVGWLRGLFPA